MKFDFIPKFKTPVMKYDELDTPYRRHFTKKIAIAVAAFVLTSTVFIFAKIPIYILLAFAICMIYLGSVAMTIYKSLTGQIQVIDTACVKVEKKEFNLFGAKDFSVLSCRLSLKTQSDFNILVDVPYASSFKENDIVRIYIDSMSLDKINENTYKAVNYIFIHTLLSD